MRVALGIAYRGTAYQGWQSQPGGHTVQDQLDAALSSFADRPVRCVCAGRTDAGVHGLNQVVHFDTVLDRADYSWVRGTNRFLPDDIAVQWCRFVDDGFHSRGSAVGRRYAYVLLESRVRPALLFAVALPAAAGCAHAVLAPGRASRDAPETRVRPLTRPRRQWPHPPHLPGRRFDRMRPLISLIATLALAICAARTPAARPGTARARRAGRPGRIAHAAPLRGRGTASSRPWTTAATLTPAGINDMVRGVARPRRAEAICRAVPRGVVQNWTGKLVTLGSSASAAASW